MSACTRWAWSKEVASAAVGYLGSNKADEAKRKMVPGQRAIVEELSRKIPTGIWRHTLCFHPLFRVGSEKTLLICAIDRERLS